MRNGTAPETTTLRLLSGKRVSRGVALAAELGVADILGNEELPIESVASRTGSDPDSLYRVLRMLAGVGMFEELPERRFRNNAESNTLRDDARNSLRDYARWYGVHRHWKAWADLDFSVQTGQPTVRKDSPDAGTFELLAENEVAQDIYNRAMTSLSAMEGEAIAGSDYDWGSGRILDVGGGQGALALRIAQIARDAQVAVFDLPHVVARVRESLEEAGVEVHGGSFFEGVAGPADLCILKHVIHNWDDDSAGRILASCREALAPGGRIVVCEMVIVEDDEDPFAKIMDVEMLVGRDGRERTQQEFERLFSAAGCRLSRIVQTDNPIRLIEVVPV